MDANAVLRSGSSNLTADETLTDFPLEPMANPLYLHILVPQIAASDTIVATAYFDDASNNHLQTVTIPTITAAGIYHMSLFCDHEDLSDLSVNLNITDADAGADFNAGAVKVWLSTSPLS